MSTSFAPTRASIAAPSSHARRPSSPLTAARAPRRHASRPSSRIITRDAAAGTSSSSDPIAAADPAEVYAVGETPDDGEHIVDAAAWVAARESTLEPDGKRGVFAMYSPSDTMLHVGYAKDVVAAVRTYVTKRHGRARPRRHLRQPRHRHARQPTRRAGQVDRRVDRRQRRR
jgi:hypothetical protein